MALSSTFIINGANKAIADESVYKDSTIENPSGEKDTQAKTYEQAKENYDKAKDNLDKEEKNLEQSQKDYENSKEEEKNLEKENKNLE